MFTTTTLDLPPSQARTCRPAPDRAPGEDHAARSSLLGLQRGSHLGRTPAVAAMEAEVLLRHLERHGEVQADTLAAELARRVPRPAPPPVPADRDGTWRAAAQASAGLEAAARVAPLGAALSGNLSAVVQQATRAASATHTHPDGVAGAVAVAIASACFARGQVAPYQLWPVVVGRMPQGPVRARVAAASELASSLPPSHAARVLRADEGDLAIHVVPFALWCAARHPNDVEGGLTAACRFPVASPHTPTITGGVVGAHAWPEGP